MKKGGDGHDQASVFPLPGNIIEEVGARSELPDVRSLCATHPDFTRFAASRKAVHKWSIYESAFEHILRRQLADSSPVSEQEGGGLLQAKLTALLNRVTRCRELGIFVCGGGVRDQDDPEEPDDRRMRAVFDVFERGVRSIMAETARVSSCIMRFYVHNRTTSAALEGCIAALDQNQHHRKDRHNVRVHVLLNALDGTLIPPLVRRLEACPRATLQSLHLAPNTWNNGFSAAAACLLLDSPALHRVGHVRYPFFSGAAPSPLSAVSDDDISTSTNEAAQTVEVSLGVPWPSWSNPELWEYVKKHATCLTLNSGNRGLSEFCAEERRASWPALKSVEFGGCMGYAPCVQAATAWEAIRTFLCDGPGRCVEVRFAKGALYDPGIVGFLWVLHRRVCVPVITVYVHDAKTLSIARLIAIRLVARCKGCKSDGDAEKWNCNEILRKIRFASTQYVGAPSVEKYHSVDEVLFGEGSNIGDSTDGLDDRERRCLLDLREATTPEDPEIYLMWSA